MFFNDCFAIVIHLRAILFRLSLFCLYCLTCHLTIHFAHLLSVKQATVWLIFTLVPWYVLVLWLLMLFGNMDLFMVNWTSFTFCIVFTVSTIVALKVTTGATHCSNTRRFKHRGISLFLNVSLSKAYLSLDFAGWGIPTQFDLVSQIMVIVTLYCHRDTDFSI